MLLHELEHLERDGFIRILLCVNVLERTLRQSACKGRKLATLVES